MRTSINRRHFVLSAGAGIVGLSVPSSPIWASSLDKVRVGIIGTSGRAIDNWTAVAAAGAEIVAVCDADEEKAKKIREQYPKAEFHTDYRKLIDARGIDAVVVSTPDHHHFHASYLAALADLHIYCEKPLTHTVGEARKLAKIVAEKKLVSQMGTQIHAENNYRRVVELIQAGAIGDVFKVHTWVPNSYAAKVNEGGLPPESKVPEGLHYDLWLGPAEERPFSKEYHPFNWRRYWAFGGGALADMACHHMDLPFWALGLRHPTTISASGSPVSPESCHKWCEVEYEFPRPKKLPVKLTWHDGGKKPSILKEIGLADKWNAGNLFIGDKGMLLADYSRYLLLPANKFKDFKAPAKTIADSIGHHKEWIEAIKTNGTTTCNFDYSGALTEAVLLGTVAYRLGRKLEWNAETMKVRGISEADLLINKQYRKGWEI